MKTSQIFLADENIPLPVIKQLRKAGCKIISVTEEFKGSSDKKVLRAFVVQLPQIRAAVRASLYLYNTEEEARKFIDVLGKTIGLFNP